MKLSSYKMTSLLIIFLVGASVIMQVFTTEFGKINFFEKHNIFFLIFITLFPRLTLLFSSVTTGGFIWWLGFFLCPRVLVAALATVAYFQTNPVLVFFSWLIAIGGEITEKVGLSGGKKRFIFRTVRTSTTPHHDQSFHSKKVASFEDSDVIEAEFTKKSE